MLAARPATDGVLRSTLNRAPIFSIPDYRATPGQAESVFRPARYPFVALHFFHRRRYALRRALQRQVPRLYLIDMGVTLSFASRYATGIALLFLSESYAAPASLASFFADNCRRNPNHTRIVAEYRLTYVP